MTEKEEEATVEVQNTKLAKASVNVLTNPNSTELVYTSSVDKMEISDDFHKLIKMCRFFYKRDPVAGTVLNKMVDCAITPLKNRKGKCTDKEYAVYCSIADMLQEFYRNVCLEYLLSGLVIPHYEWVRKSGRELSEDLDSRTRFYVPDNIWFRDPATVKVKKSILPNRKDYYVEVSRDLVDFIRSGGKKKDGTVDKELYDILVKNYKEFVDAVKNSKSTKLEIKLENIRPFLGKCLPESAYPQPYMTNALESLMHKRNLKKLDYAIASRVIAAIQLIKLGNDTFPVTDAADFTDIKTQMNYSTVEGDYERIFQLFANHTLTIEWVHPDTSAMLNNEKYRTVENDIISAFGFPRTLITGETIRSNVEGGSDLATFSPVATMETLRDKLVEWTKILYKEIMEKNGFKNYPAPRFEPMKLYRLLDLNLIGKDTYEEGNMSRSTRLEMLGFDLETELERKKLEQEKFKELGLDEAPPMPYSANPGGNPSGRKASEPNTGPRPSTDVRNTQPRG